MNEELLNRFYHHINGVATESEIHMALKKNNVIRSKYEIYRRFIFALIDVVYETYLGHDCITREEDIVAHFKWCYKQAAKQFKDTKLQFAENDELFDYFCEYFKENLYLSYEQRDNDISNFAEFFNMDNPRLTNSQAVSFSELYVLFDKTHYAGRMLVK